jgi:hypothetical protein
MSNVLSDKEFILMTALTDHQAAVLFAGLSWNKMLELRSEYTRALDRYARKNKGSINGMDNTQLEAIGAIARFDRLLRTRYYNAMKNAPRFYGMDKKKAKGIILAEFYTLTRKKY